MMIDESTKYVKDCYNILNEMQIIDSQYQFSKQFLGKCANYYGVMICENRRASNDLLYHLNEKMGQVGECFNDNRLKPLLECGKRLLRDRFERYYK